MAPSSERTKARSNLTEDYRFTNEELDFILNYDIKYRLGLGGSEEDES
jgi:hypothetical protein